MTVDFLITGPENAALTIALAHGAGAPMDSQFMEVFADGLAAHGHRVARFEFPYMVKRRLEGTKRPPDRAPVLRETWLSVIDALGGADGLVIGGKSMGGRIASLVADAARVKGLVCLGYPFHPPGRPEKTRTEHLEMLGTPTLICQGTRDTLGNAQDVAGYTLSSAIGVHWLEDGDHGFKPRKASGLTEHDNVAQAVDAVHTFVVGL